MKIVRDFDSLYKSVRENNPELVSLPAEPLERLSEQYRTEGAAERLSNFIAIAATAPLIFAGIIVCFSTMWRLTDVMSLRLSGYHYRALDTIPGLTKGLAAGAFALFFYFAFFPFLARFLSNPHGGPFDGIKWLNRRFIFSAIVAVYIALGWAIVGYASYFDATPSFLRVAFRAWLVPPGVVLSVAPFGLVIGITILFQRAKSRKPASEIQVLDNLLRILERWPDTTSNGPLSLDEKRIIAWKLRTAAQSIRRLHFRIKPMDPAEEWAANQMKLAADNLLVCISWLYVSQIGTFENVRMRVVNFSNSFLTGRLHELPREEVSENEGLKKPARKQRLMRTISVTIAVLAYCLAPVIIYFFVRDRLQSVTVPDSLLLLLYSLWIIAGLYAYLEQTSQNAGATIVDLVKGILGR